MDNTSTELAPVEEVVSDLDADPVVNKCP